MNRAAPAWSVVSRGGGFLLLVAWGCHPAGEALSPGAESAPDQPSAHPSDGQGHVLLTPDDAVVCGSSGTWTVAWVAGADGLPAGGAVVLQVSPFWGWSPPQRHTPDLAGFTTASAPAGVTLDVVEGQVPFTILARVNQGRLAPGDTLRFVYGDTAAGGPGSAARVDTYAERFEELLIKTDGNGDGLFAPVAEQPTLRILAGAASHVAVAAPACVRPGERFRVGLHGLDARDNRTRLPSSPASVLLRPLRDDPGEPVEEPRELGRALPDSTGAVEITVAVASPGLYRLEARCGAELRGANDLLLVDDSDTFSGIRWGDIHVHSALSDGTGAPDDLYAYARDVVGLDVCAVTDHDAHGLWPLADGNWERVREATRRFHDPGHFVTLLAYEWTSWTWGHRNVYYPGDKGEVFAFRSEDSDTPSELWDRIAPFGGITIPHHPAGGPVAMDWSVPSPEERETVVEICSIHGSSETLGVERGIYRPVPGHSVRDALNLGHRLGILGSGDTHDGHPGRRSLGAPTNGLAAFRSATLTREGVMAAVAHRAVYGTSGPRVLLATDWGGNAPGTTLAGPSPRPVVVRVVAPEPVERVELVGPGGVLAKAWGGGRRVTRQLEAPAEDNGAAWRYVRVVLADGEVAWESPWWIGGDE